MRLKIIVCEVLYREFCFCASRSENVVDLEFLSQGLHDLESAAMRDRLQFHINRVAGGGEPAREVPEGTWVGYRRRDVTYDAVGLGFALCSNGIVGLEAPRDIPLVVPRAHDCITLLLGSRDRYKEVFDAHPGTYFISTGWRERDAINLEKMEETEMSKMGLDKSYEEYVAKYGEENAKYLMETLTGGLKHYDRLTYIRTGLGRDAFWEQEAKEEAKRRGWQFEILQGDLRLIQALCDGRWDESDFLVLGSGQKVEACYSGEVIRACCQGGGKCQEK